MPKPGAEQAIPTTPQGAEAGLPSGFEPDPNSTRDPFQEIQDRLGVDEAMARDFGSVYVECPKKGEEGEATREMSFADFMISEHGKEKADNLLNAAEAAVKAGADPEFVIELTLAMSSVTDPETGKLKRVEPMAASSKSVEPPSLKKN